MSATNSTTNYNLPLFIGTDKPAWLTDWNGAMNAIDTAVGNVATAESGTAASLSALTSSVESLGSTVSDHGTAISTLSTAVSGNTGSINTINSLIGNGEPTTTDKTIIGAINEINAEIPDVTVIEQEISALQGSVVTAKVDIATVQAALGDISQLTTTDKSSVVAAINEINAGGGGDVYEKVAEVTADGVKTFTVLLGELFAAITNVSAISPFAKVTSGDSVFSLNAKSSSELDFNNTVFDMGNSRVITEQYKLASTSKRLSIVSASSGNTISDNSSSVPTNGLKFALYDLK